MDAQVIRLVLLYHCIWRVHMIELRFMWSVYRDIYLLWSMTGGIWWMPHSTQPSGHNVSSYAWRLRFLPWASSWEVFGLHGFCTTPRPFLVSRCLYCISAFPSLICEISELLPAMNMRLVPVLCGWVAYWEDEEAQLCRYIPGISTPGGSSKKELKLRSA